jgi:2',3'-cyclic-nucleotide 2'-phosphodiesterase (5'-nucleotidase family)
MNLRTAAVAALLASLSVASVAMGGGNKHDKEKGLFKLQILHSSDNESSFQDPNTLEPKILHYATVVKGLQKLAAKERTHSLHLTAGDHTIPGPFYQASAQVPELGAPGLGDIAIYNLMKVRANGMGNHEFDGGINEFAQMLRVARYPFIAVNLDFSNVQLDPGVPDIRIGREKLPTWANAGKVVHSTWISVGGERIGLIGRAPADFFNIIEDPDTTLPGLDFVGGRDDDNQPLVPAIEQVLEEVDFLERRGKINKIILIDHAQDFTGDPLSASELRGIDIIIAAGSTGFMAKPEADGPFNLLRPGDSPGADYPTVREDSEGENVLVVNSDQLYRYVGNLMVAFDEDGRIIEVDDRSGPVATTEEAIDALEDVLDRPLYTPWRVEEIYNALQNTPLIQDAFNVVGTTTAPLNGNRADVRSRETNLGRLAADSTLWFARNRIPGFNEEVDIALKNGGGIRDSILGPNITRLTIGAALLFDNRIAVLRMTGDQLLAAMENAVSRVPALDGRFPHIAGMTLEYDASEEGIQGSADQTSLTTPSRIKRLVVTRNDGSIDVLVDGGAAQGDLTARSFVLATNSFLVTGGDGYFAFGAAELLTQTEIGEQRILEEYIVDGLGGTVDLLDPSPEPRVVRQDIP